MAGKIISGLKAVHEALLSDQGVNRVYVTKGAKGPQVEQILDTARDRRVVFEFVPLAKMSSLTQSREHQNVAAAISPVQYVDIDQCLGDAPPQATILVLDQVQHSRNLGMILRAAAGAGVHAVLLPARGSALLDDTVVRASAGALFHLAVMTTPNLAQALRKFKERDFWIFGLDAKGEENVFTFDWPDRTVLVVGNETKGISAGVRKECDALASIPLAGSLDSLNVAMAAGIALFQVRARWQAQKKPG
jgi:23S rRNA (guanosine2251-2'-O)-methyltransferase